jgi:hypothetical protein
VRGQNLSSQENDETEERETGSTMPADSVRRLGSLTGHWQMSGRELIPTNNFICLEEDSTLEMSVRKRAELTLIIQGQDSSL